MYKYVFFDLDGTLTDPFEGITNSVAYALEKFGIRVEDRKTLSPFIGPPLVDSFKEYFGFDEVFANKAVEYYREYFSVKGLYENKVYNGVEKTLEELKKRGYKPVIATSKPEIFTVKILKKFNLTKYFDFVSGATLDQTRVKKADVIAYAVEKLNIVDKSEIIMVGDRKFDVEGARQNGIDTVGVLYGYGDREEMEIAKPKIIIENILDLLDLEGLS